MSISTQRAFAIRAGIKDERYGLRHVVPTYFTFGYLGFPHQVAYLQARGIWNSFWDYSRCPRWYIPIAFFFRAKSYIPCALGLHKVKKDHIRSSTYHGWRHLCMCGYRGYIVHDLIDVFPRFTK